MARFGLCLLFHFGISWMSAYVTRSEYISLKIFSRNDGQLLLGYSPRRDSHKWVNDRL